METGLDSGRKLLVGASAVLLVAGVATGFTLLALLAILIVGIALT